MPTRARLRSNALLGVLLSLGLAAAALVAPAAPALLDVAGDLEAAPAAAPVLLACAVVSARAPATPLSTSHAFLPPAPLVPGGPPPGTHVRIAQLRIDRRPGLVVTGPAQARAPPRV